MKSTPGADTPYSAAEQRRLTEEIARISFSDEQKEARALLVFVGTDPRFLQILPARFDIERLRRIEEKTRAVGIAC